MKKIQRGKSAKKHINKKVKIKKNVIETKKNYIIAGGTEYITKKQMESCWRIISYYIRRARRRVENCMQLTIPITRKARFSRMGSGKGRVRKIVCKVHKNSILYKFDDIGAAKMLKVYKAVKSRLPVAVYLKEKRNDISRDTIRSGR